MPRRNRGAHLVYRRDRGAYYISWTERGRSRRRATGTSDREEAEALLQEFLAHRPRRQGPRDPFDYAIVEALEAYGVEQAPNTAAPERIGYAIEALLPFWESRVVGDVTRETCRAYARERDRAPGTIRRELTTLRAAINHAVREGRLTRPVTVWLPPKPEGRDRWLTRTEAAALLRAARRDPRCRLYLPLFVQIALYTGARKEAILSLRWTQIDLGKGLIDFNPPGRARTKKGRPIIPTPTRLLWFLYRARARGGELGYVINRHGRPVLDIKRSFATAADRAGLSDVTPHTLRHTAGTWMAHAGVPLWEIAGYLGQSHARTAELYAHHHPDHLKRAVEAFK